jgi:UPF0176 protein
MIEHAALDRPLLAGNIKDGYRARIAMTYPARPVGVAALYKFAPFEDYEATRRALDALWRTNGIKSTFLIVHEGINGTIAGSDAGIETVLAHIRALPGGADLDVGTS